MNTSSDRERFEWLESGRALGDLTPEEFLEWQALAPRYSQTAQSPSFDSIADALDRALGEPEDIPERLQTELLADLPDASPSERTQRPHILRVIFGNVSVAWGIAALLALGVWLNKQPRTGPSRLDVEQRLAQAIDRVALPLNAAEDSNTLLGAIVWSDTLQEGYMELSGLAPNNPSDSQYQLWIVDPDRDTRPVDGGVFDIPETTALSVRVPIDARLPIAEPTGFVITLEKPGGVVVSGQERVIAVASL